MLGGELFSNPPRVLIHLHIRKAGGTSLNSAIKHAFRRHEVFELYAEGGCEHTSLNVASLDSVSRMLSDFGLDRVRYISGHIPFGVHGLFEDDAQYFTLVRDPVDRVISNFFFWFGTRRPFCRAGKRISFEEYVESGDDIYLNNYQVRVLSGAPEFNFGTAPNGPQELIFGPPVERRHLEQAKHNIAEHFLVAAPLERLTETALFLRMKYGWPMRRLHNEYKNRTPTRPPAGEMSPRLLKMIERNNAYDAELYHWVKHRFAGQCMLLEPQLTKDFKRFQRINGVLDLVGKYLPHKTRKRIAAAVLHGRGMALNFFS